MLYQAAWFRPGPKRLPTCCLRRERTSSEQEKRRDINPRPQRQQSRIRPKPPQIPRCILRREQVRPIDLRQITQRVHERERNRPRLGIERTHGHRSVGQGGAVRGPDHAVDQDEEDIARDVCVDAR